MTALDAVRWEQLGLQQCLRLTIVAVHFYVSYGPMHRVTAQQQFVIAVVAQLPLTLHTLTLQFDLTSSHTAKFSCLLSRATWAVIATHVHLLPDFRHVQLEMMLPCFIALPNATQKATLLRKVQAMFSRPGEYLRNVRDNA